MCSSQRPVSLLEVDTCPAVSHLLARRVDLRAVRHCIGARTQLALQRVLAGKDRARRQRRCGAAIVGSRQVRKAASSGSCQGSEALSGVSHCTQTLPNKSDAYLAAAAARCCPAFPSMAGAWCQARSQMAGPAPHWPAARLLLLAACCRTAACRARNRRMRCCCHASE